MKSNLWLILSLGLSTSVLAQVTNLPPAGAIQEIAETPAAVLTNASTASATIAATNTPATAARPAVKERAPKQAAKKAAAKKAPAQVFAPYSTPLTPGPAAVAGNNVNVRGQARLNSEVITKMTKDQQVTVLEEIVRNNSASDEPSAWAKIVLPAGTPVWVHSNFVSNNTVVPARLNLRSGPGENYSAIGLLTRGTTITPVTTKGSWIQIEQPGEAFGFVASQYLKQSKGLEIASVAAGTNGTTMANTAATEIPATTEAATDAGNTTIPETPVTTAAVAEDAAMAAAPGEPVPTEALATATAPKTNLIAAATTPAGTNDVAEMSGTATPDEEATTDEAPLPKRIVSREGIVRGTTSIQAPTHFALVNPVNYKLINYLYSPSESLDLRRYKGLRIIVTGEEAIEERWGNTPVITIQSLELLDE